MLLLVNCFELYVKHQHLLKLFYGWESGQVDFMSIMAVGDFLQSITNKVMIQHEGAVVAMQ